MARTLHLAVLPIILSTIAGISYTETGDGRRSIFEESDVSFLGNSANPTYIHGERFGNSRYELSAYNRSLLIEAGYSIGKEDVVTDSNGVVLEDFEVDRLLNSLRAKRKKSALAALTQVNQNFMDEGGTLTSQGAAKAQAVLARDWEVIPPGIRGRANELLSQHSFKPIRGPNLDLLQHIGEDWMKHMPSVTNDPAAQHPYPQPEEYQKQYHGKSPGSDDLQPSVFGTPSKQAIPARIKQVKSMGLSPFVTDALCEIMRYAPDEDAEKVLEEFRYGARVIESNKDAQPFSAGSAKMQDNVVVLPEYFVFSKNPNEADDPDALKLPHADPSFYEALGLPVPALDALNPNAKPVKQFKDAAGNFRQVFADGSARLKWSAKNSAGLLEHEIFHIRTWNEGGGANTFANEMRSFFASQRLWFNQAEVQGYARDYADKAPWVHYPISFRNEILATYLGPEVGAIRPDEISVEAQLARVERDLSARGEDIQRLAATEIDKQFKAQTAQRLAIVDRLRDQGLINSSEAAAARQHIHKLEKEERSGPGEWDYRQELIEVHERLLKDQEIENQIFYDDWRWHAARGLPYSKKPDESGTAGIK